MDIEKLKAEFEQSECFKKLEHVAQYTFFEFGAYIKRTDVPDAIEKKCGKLITALLFSWSAWKEAKATAVPSSSCSINSHELVINETKQILIDRWNIHGDDQHLLESLVYRGVCIGKAQANAVPEGYKLVKKPKPLIGNKDVDFSQAPEWANFWLKDGYSKRCIWSNKRPKLDLDIGCFVFPYNYQALEAPDFGFDGDWIKSLTSRKAFSEAEELTND